jgi:hypothetical protein
LLIWLATDPMDATLAALTALALLAVLCALSVRTSGRPPGEGERLGRCRRIEPGRSGGEVDIEAEEGSGGLVGEAVVDVDAGRAKGRDTGRDTEGSMVRSPELAVSKSQVHGDADWWAVLTHRFDSSLSLTLSSRRRASQCS